MKIAVVQQNYVVGDIEGNLDRIFGEVVALRTEYGESLKTFVFGGNALQGGRSEDLMGLGQTAGFRNRLEEAHQAISQFQKQKGVRLLLEDASREDAKAVCASEYYRHGVAEWNLEVIRCQAALENRTVVWVNPAGAQTDTIYYGGSVVCRPNGSCLKLPMFEEATVVIDFTRDDWEIESADWGDKMEQVRGALELGIRDYFRKNRIQDACVALSGGIDSALVLALAVEALGPEHVKVLMLPSEYSSEHSVSDSTEMLGRLGIPEANYDLISIAPAFRTILDSLEPVFAQSDDAGKQGLAEENIQARIRMIMLMALSNAQGALMLNTSNKSEMAVGYGTLYADTGGAIGVIADLYKTEVYELSRYLNRRAAQAGFTEPIPEHIITKAPSAELRPDQKDSDSLPDYDVLDAVLAGLIEGRMPVERLVETGFDRTIVERVARMVLSGDFKRKQLPPALRLSGTTFGREWVWPITGVKKL